MAQVITPQDIRSLLGNLARPNYYQMTFSLPLQGGLRPYLLSKGVDQRFISEDIGLLCNTATLPGTNLATTENYNRVGIKNTFAHTAMYDSLKLEFFVDNSYKTIKFFENWINFIISGQGEDIGNFNYARELRYPAEYKTSGCKVFKFENDNRSIDSNLRIRRYIDYSFFGLFPVDIYETPLIYGPDSSVMSLSVNFSYDRHVISNPVNLTGATRQDNNFVSIAETTLRNLNNGVVNQFINL